MIDAEVAQPFVEQFQTAIDNAELNSKPVVLVRLETAQKVMDWINSLETGLNSSNHNRDVALNLLREAYENKSPRYP